MKILLTAWFIVLSVYAFIAMGWDKNKANNKGWRISEKHFFIVAALGGSLGVLTAMSYWRHKTQKWAFKGPIYGIITLQVLLVMWWWFKFLG